MTYISDFYDNIVRKKVEAIFFTFFKKNIAEMLSQETKTSTIIALIHKGVWA